jgi:calcineurin-like phosphoesterase
MPTRFPVATGAVRLCGAIIDIDTQTGRCLAIKRVSKLIQESHQE